MVGNGANMCHILHDTTISDDKTKIYLLTVLSAHPLEFYSKYLMQQIEIKLKSSFNLLSQALQQYRHGHAFLSKFKHIMRTVIVLIYFIF